MSDFVKPRHLVIDAIPYLKEIMGDGIIKDLQDGEEICPVCHGTGLMVANNIYGLDDDPDKKVGMFPYKHQTVSSCNNCYNGVVKKCKYCGKLLNRRTYQCDCEDARSDREDLQIQKAEEAEQKRLMKATVLAWNDSRVKDFDMLYSDLYCNNEGYFSDWDEFFDDWECNHEGIDTERPAYVWSTSKRGMSIDANYIIENACDDLWEDARDQISDKDEKELQDFLTKWANKQTGTTTYDVDYKYAIGIPWEEYNKDRSDK